MKKHFATIIFIIINVIIGIILFWKFSFTIAFLSLLISNIALTYLYLKKTGNYDYTLGKWKKIENKAMSTVLGAIIVSWLGTFSYGYIFPDPINNVLDGQEVIKEKIVLPIRRKREKLQVENQKLASLRDWLLPMLMNGQVTVGGAKDKLEMVAEDNRN